MANNHRHECNVRQTAIEYGVQTLGKVGDARSGKVVRSNAGIRRVLLLVKRIARLSSRIHETEKEINVVISKVDSNPEDSDMEQVGVI